MRLANHQFVLHPPEQGLRVVPVTTWRRPISGGSPTADHGTDALVSLRDKDYLCRRHVVGGVVLELVGFSGITEQVLPPDPAANPRSWNISQIDTILVGHHSNQWCDIRRVRLLAV
jgi:hypothetical protein